MIHGTLVLEDTQVTFTLTNDSRAVVSVSDAVSGKSVQYETDGAAFMTALGIALSFDGDVPPDREAAWKAAESAQPRTPELRFIP